MIKYFLVEFGALQGLFAPVAQITPHCPTGNCTWPAHRTLGACSVCMDVSNYATPSCNLDAKAGSLDCTYSIKDLEAVIEVAYTNKTVVLGGGGQVSNSSTASWSLVNSLEDIFVQFAENMYGQPDSTGVIAFCHVLGSCYRFCAKD